MKQGKISLTEVQKDSIGIIYFSVKNALEACETLLKDKSLETIVRFNFIRIWAIVLKKVKDQMDKSLGCNERFEEQIKETDTQGLQNVISGYISLSPELRDEVENMFDKLRKEAA
jgi:ribosomal protein S17E